MGGMVAQELALAAPERVRDADARLHVPAAGRRRTLTDRSVVETLAEAVLSGDDERTLRAGYEVNVSPPSTRPSEGNYELFAEVADAVPGAAAGAHGPAAGDHRATTRASGWRAIARADARRPRHRRPDARRRPTASSSRR